MSETSPEPLRALLGLDKKRYSPHGGRSREKIIFYSLIGIFLLGLVYFGQHQTSPTGRVTYGTNSKLIDISQVFDANQSFNISTEANITSIRISGAFAGEGAIEVYADNLLVLDSRRIKDNKLNLITGLALENLSQPENLSLNPGENAADENLTTDLSSNGSNLDVSGNLDENNIVTWTFFKDYCIDSCTINLSDEFTIMIVVDDAVLNLSSLIYNYADDVGNNASANRTQSATNITPVDPDITINNTENMTLNTSGSLMINLSSENLTNESAEDVVSNLTENPEIDVSNNSVETVDNDTSLDPNQEISDNLPLTIDMLNKSFSKRGMNLFDRDSDGTFRIGSDDSNFVVLHPDKLSDIQVGMWDSGDSRLKSRIVELANLTSAANITFKDSDADVILRCLQLENTTCKKWVKTDIVIRHGEGYIGFNTDESGVYAAALTKAEKKEYIPANSVYYNSDCKYCEKAYDCNAKKFCVMQTANADFMAQLDFDIFSIDDNFDSAEVCSYVYYNSWGPTINYLKYSEESYCSDISNANLSSTLISYSLINGGNGWACIDATQMVKEAASKSYSNLFMNLIGQELSKEMPLFNCFYGFSDLDNCDGANPSGASDCRPYMRINYK